MNYSAVITDTRTGETVTTHFGEWLDHTPFFWSREGGNYGCDCNRGATFDQARGIDTDVMDDDCFPCGEGRYIVPKLILDDGTEVVIDGGTSI